MALALPFEVGQWVVLVLREPRERMWGRLLGIEAPGIVVRGLDAKMWDESLAMIRQGEGAMVSVGTRFYPMHRVESLYLDEASSGVSSMVDDFRERTLMDPAEFLG